MKKTTKQNSLQLGKSFNAAVVALDRHISTHATQKILTVVSEDFKKREYTYQELSTISNQFANALVSLNVTKGDRVFLFLPRVVEVFVSFLGILKIGAIAGTLFSAFQEQALLDRLSDSEAKVIVTTQELFPRLERIWNKLPNLNYVILIDATTSKDNVLSYTDLLEKQSPTFTPVLMKSSDPAFMLYTSGTTGKPKGIVHGHGAILQQYKTFQWAFEAKENDIYWCSADHGWITGITYEIMGPLANSVPTIYFEGKFSAYNWYKVIEQYKVTVWYTAPTALRMLMSVSPVENNYNLSSLRHIASVGEPLNPEVILWGKKVFGQLIYDTWFQTELCCISIANTPVHEIKIGSMGKPLPGIRAAIVDDDGNELMPETEGNLVLRPDFPSVMIDVWKNKEKYNFYFKHGWYWSGDKAWMDTDGYFWFLGRTDDIINTAGERVGPFEVESALLQHMVVKEAGVIGKPDEVRGEIIKAFVVLHNDVTPSEQLKKELMEFVKKHLSGHEYPREVEFIPSLPKTRSGKIMRRVLKAQDAGLPLGDTSTLEEF